MTKTDDKLMEKIVSLAKRRGFVYQAAEIYGGMAGGYDLGPLGADLTYNLKDIWWKMFVSDRDDIYNLSTTTMLPEKVWQASGHLENFIDPLAKCSKCDHVERADHLVEKHLNKNARSRTKNAYLTLSNCWISLPILEFNLFV